jgi:hypothetical protein
LWIKGVLHPADARRAQATGAAGIVVSNHGGRTLDGTPATAQALPRIAEATGGSLPLLVDGGIRRGTDVLKALALGASAVLVGRPIGWGLASAGPLGVAHVLRVLRDEFMKAMTPSPQLAAIVGDKPLPRTDVTKKVWEYIKKNKLQDEVQKRIIVADAKLKEIFGKAKADMFEMTKLINSHLK